MTNATQPNGAELEEIVWKTLRAHFGAAELEGTEIWFEEFGLNYEPDSTFESVLAINLYHPNGEQWPHPAATAAAHSQLVFEASQRGDSRLPMLYHTSMKPPVNLRTPQKAA
jgi:hypothetical protein